MKTLGDFRDVKHRTIFHDLLESSTLPPEDKTVGRLWQEGQVLLSAGTVTTATSMYSALVYLLLDPKRLQVLLEELENAIPDIAKPLREAELEQLPYLVRDAVFPFSSIKRLRRSRTQLFRKRSGSCAAFPIV